MVAVDAGEHQLGENFGGNSKTVTFLKFVRVFVIRARYQIKD